MRNALLLSAALIASANALRVTVLGGTGFVGSRVVRKLVADGGAEVTSVSRRGTAGIVAPWASEPWTASVRWAASDLTRGPREEMREAIGEPDVVISCVGQIGFDVQQNRVANGVANVEAARCVPGASRYVFVSVASEVAAAEGWLPDQLAGYFSGKRDAEEGFLEAAGEVGSCTFVKPSFIYGGDRFGLFPPRVTAAYGAAVEELLSAGPIQKLADALPGLLKVALRPPVSVDAVAEACAAAALGRVDARVLDGTAAINEAAAQPAPTGLSELLGNAKAKVAAFAEELTSTSD